MVGGWWWGGVCGWGWGWGGGRGGSRHAPAPARPPRPEQRSQAGSMQAASGAPCGFRGPQPGPRLLCLEPGPRSCRSRRTRRGRRRTCQGFLRGGRGGGPHKGGRGCGCRRPTGPPATRFGALG